MTTMPLTTLTDHPAFVRTRPSVGPPKPLPTAPVIGFDLARASRAETVYWIADRAQSRKPTHIAFLNAHCANTARRDWRYRDTLKHADALLPDGSGVALAAKLDGRNLGENLNGTDLFAPLCRCLAFRRLPVFFLGGRPG
ncbi:MAG: WecB/TagA/CpsF family glycosyltransferase, partial [Pseudomonadota bacterium]